MHPELCKKLVAEELDQARASPGLFCEAVALEQAGYPELFVRFVNRHGATRLLRFDCTNYDFQAIAVEPVDPVSRAPLQPEAWMLRSGGAFPGHHMRGGRPFLCVAGTRDYYTHESHRPVVAGERWEGWRAEFRIPDLVGLIKQKFASGGWE